jgi:Putative prokaryotic signal transducing protein
MEHKSDSKLVCIYRTPSYDQLAPIKSLLEANKIPYTIEDEEFGYSTGIAVVFSVMVETNYSENAKELLSKII